MTSLRSSRNDRSSSDRLRLVHSVDHPVDPTAQAQLFDDAAFAGDAVFDGARFPHSHRPALRDAVSVLFDNDPSPLVVAALDGVAVRSDEAVIDGQRTHAEAAASLLARQSDPANWSDLVGADAATLISESLADQAAAVSELAAALAEITPSERATG